MKQRKWHFWPFLWILFYGIGFAAQPTPVTFERACDPAESQLTIAAVGDILPYDPLQDQARESTLGFRSIWQESEHLLRNADIAYGNLEGPVADGYSLGGYPSFNYDVRLLDDLKAAGFSVLSTANNHAMDRYRKGLDRTIRNLLLRGISFFGTQAGPAAAAGFKREFGYEPSWYAIVEAKGFRTAWISCTYGLNLEIDTAHQVMHCYRDQNVLLELIRKLSARKDLDAVFVTPHWGVQYDFYPGSEIRELGRKFLQAGALAVFGAHPHVLQPIEKHLINGQEKFIAYSLGDFISANPKQERRTTLVLYLGLSKSKNGKTWINGVRYVPLHLLQEGNRYSLVPMDRVAPPTISRDIIGALFHTFNESPSAEPLSTNPGCTGS